MQSQARNEASNGGNNGGNNGKASEIASVLGSGEETVSLLLLANVCEESLGPPPLLTPFPYPARISLKIDVMRPTW